MFAGGFKIMKRNVEYDDFSKKVTLASGILCSLCPCGNPSEQQILEACRRVELPVVAADDSLVTDSYVCDPVRFAVFVNAYKPRLRTEVTMQVMIDRAWCWLEKQRRQSLNFG